MVALASDNLNLVHTQVVPNLQSLKAWPMAQYTYLRCCNLAYDAVERSRALDSVTVAKDIRKQNRGLKESLEVYALQMLCSVAPWDDMAWGRWPNNLYEFDKEYRELIAAIVRKPCYRQRFYRLEREWLQSEYWTGLTPEFIGETLRLEECKQFRNPTYDGSTVKDWYLSYSEWENTLELWYNDTMDTAKLWGIEICAFEDLETNELPPTQTYFIH